jgi:hypothetical protein
VRRMIWFGIGAAAGYVAARRGEQAVEEARERGLVGNVSLVATTASKAAATASRTVLSVGEAAGSAARRRAAGPAATPSASERPAPSPTPSTARPS